MWQLRDSQTTIKVGKYSLPCYVEAGSIDCIRRLNKTERVALALVGWADNLHGRMLRNGFLEKNVGTWIKRYSQKGDVILDVGCGDGRLYKYVPRDCQYYGFDVRLREDVIGRLLKKRNASLAVASALSIPVDDAQVDVVTCTEVLEHIPDYTGAIREIHRVLKPGGHCLVSIPNGFCHKYVRLGSHHDHVNTWSYREAIGIFQDGLRLIEGKMMGRWVPLPHWVGRFIYQLPMSHPSEFYNTNFLFVFEAEK